MPVCALAQLAVLLLAALMLAPPTARAAMQDDDPAKRCGALVGASFSGLTDAPTQITKASFTPATPARAGYCSIEGYVSPAVGFGMLLPATGWNGKFIEQGCGGFCGTVAIEFACAGHLGAGYACLQTDMGHKSSLSDTKWAIGNPEAITDFGYRSTHVAAIAGKAIVDRFYGGDPKHSYFLGCSTGGRQAMVSAERFPLDFDGIVAVAPVISETGASMQLLWSVRANLDAKGQPILPASKLPMLHDAVIAACDMNDGIKDGLIGDPRSCHFDPAMLACKGGDTPDCLTAAQLQVVRTIYAGPHDSAGRPLYTGGLQLGSELGWAPAYIGLDGKPAAYAGMMNEFWHRLGFLSPPDSSWDAIRDFDFDRDPARVGGMETIYSGSNIDLRKFEASGGKLIMAQGWNDNSVVPLNAIDYYDGVTRFMGGIDHVRQFFRLFPVPGMEHCQGGAGPWGINYVTALDRWVTGHQAPELLIGQHPKPGVTVPWLGTGIPLPAKDVAFSRPIFAYPARTIYSGSGDANTIASYVGR